jgi:hypothetical protein
MLHASLDGFKYRLHHDVHLCLLLNHLRRSRSTHVSDMVDSKIMKYHRTPVVSLHLVRNMASDIVIDLNMVLFCNVRGILDRNWNVRLDITEVRKPLMPSERKKKLAFEDFESNERSQVSSPHNTKFPPCARIRASQES